MLRAPLLASAAILALLATAPANAQNAAIESQRQAVFQQMLSDPSNRSLMSEYARLSVQLRDFEAAAATLERLVDLEPTNTAARVELAIAYFALGSYDVARYHLAAAQASGALTPEQAARVARYQEESAERNDGSEHHGRLEVGYAWTQDAGERGTFINAGLDWRLDMGGPFAAQWVTELAYSGFQTGDSSFNGRQSARVRMGPEFRLNGDAYGPRIQPYVEVEWFRDDDLFFGDYASYEFGAAYQNPINERFTVYADASYGWAYSIEDGFGIADYEFHEVDLGATYRPSRDTRIRLSARWFSALDESFFPVTTNEASVRLSAQHAFDPGFLDVPNRWVVGAFGETGTIEREDEFGVFDDISQQSYGVWLRAFVYEDIYVEGSASRIYQEEDFGFFVAETEETVLTMQLGWEF